ncbi:hypothetical protein FOC89_00185 (plasmid) [Bacillus thuringiensis]|uniref:Uncharacterized protein n=1 Tax=Bacillus thuringiensis TaxID=1428 RepID=A0A0B5NN98_BACTU|nr:hypothetical protein [Bacillus thuringiensis]AJG73643.1 hypothetical protein BF38_6112 [Bacillus thuringiensis]OTX59401.1 hypothetical protein BK723_04285 [Bacillus thuringiensis serovar pondicheriensis]QKH22437.1 hypothetical protein FOC89_00185 [Bacillus thuringiensis]
MDKERIWNDIQKVLIRCSVAPTMHNQEDAEVVEVSNEYIHLKLKEKTRTKNRDLILTKVDFIKTLTKLEEKREGLRRKDLNGRKARYLLGILNLLPEFQVVDREVFEKGQSRNKKFLVYI